MKCYKTLKSDDLIKDGDEYFWWDNNLKDFKYSKIKGWENYKFNVEIFLQKNPFIKGVLRLEKKKNIG